MDTLTSDQAFLLMMARDAKEVRDAEGITNPERDAQLARFESGDFGRPVHALDMPTVSRPQGNPNTVGGYGRKLPAKATEKQVAFILSLASQLNDSEKAEIITRNAPALTKREASDKIGELLEEVKGQPKAKAQTYSYQPAQRTENVRKAADAGWYAYDGTIVKVQENRAHTATYAKRFNLDTGEYVYAPGLQYKVTDKLTLEEASRISLSAQHALNGTCAMCGRELTDEESMTVGIGPICRDKL